MNIYKVVVTTMYIWENELFKMDARLGLQKARSRMDKDPELSCRCVYASVLKMIKIKPGTYIGNSSAPFISED